MHDHTNSPTLIAVEPPTLPAARPLPPPEVYPPAFPAPQRSAGGRLARIVRRLSRRRGRRRQSPGQ